MISLTMQTQFRLRHKFLQANVYTIFNEHQVYWVLVTAICTVHREKIRATAQVYGWTLTVLFYKFPPSHLEKPYNLLYCAMAVRSQPIWPRHRHETPAFETRNCNELWRAVYAEQLMNYAGVSAGHTGRPLYDSWQNVHEKTVCTDSLW